MSFNIVNPQVSLVQSTRLTKTLLHSNILSRVFVIRDVTVLNWTWTGWCSMCITCCMFSFVGMLVVVQYSQYDSAEQRQQAANTIQDSTLLALDFDCQN